MRLLLLIVAVAATAACTPRPNAPVRESNMSETVYLSASSDAVRGIESDLRTAIDQRHGDAGAGISINENSGPLSPIVNGNSAILNAAFEDARIKARALAGAVHATLGDVIADDEVNAADNAPRYGGGGIGLKGNVASSRVSLNGNGPEIVRVTFALSAAHRGPTEVTVYGLQATRPAQPEIPAPTGLSININAGGDDALKTVTSWETIVRDAARRRGVRDADVHVGNVNATFASRAR